LLDITLGTVIHQAKESGWISGSVAVKPVKKDLISFQNNDAGNAERFHSIHGENFRYHRDSGTWLRWNGIRWIKADEACTQAFIMTMRAYGIQAAQLPDPLIAQAHTRHALKSCDLARVNAGITLAKSIAGISVSSADLDNNPMIVCAQNAVIDLCTGEEIPPHRDMLLTKQLGTHYDKNAHCPLWLEFLETATSGDQELIDYLQAAMGYTLTGDCTEECMFFFHGGGGNGKGVFMKTSETMLGDYSQTAPESVFVLNNHGGGIPNDLARLVGCRMSIATELEEGAAFAESRIKALTGNDTITARFLHKEFFDFPPTHKFWISGNHKPRIRGTDKGIWRRMRLIPFTVKIPENKKDTQLKEKLMAELPGILNWAIQGCIRWRQKGLVTPQCVSQATDEYRQSQDIIGQFLDEATVEDAGALKKMELYNHYQQWATARGILIKYQHTYQKFNSSISDRDIFVSAHSNVGATWRGVAIKPL
jgi:putative DNA primase/helicase